MKPSEMKRIAEERTRYHGDDDERIHLTDDDVEFYKMASLNWDKLMAVVEAANRSEFGCDDCYEGNYIVKKCDKCDLAKTLQALEQE